MKYSRNDESQADAVGAVILYKAGYNPQAMVDFFKTMGAQPGAAPPELFSSHPNPGNRQQAIQKQIGHRPAQNYVADSPNFDKIHERAVQVKAYTAEEIRQAQSPANGLRLIRGTVRAYSPAERARFPPRLKPLPFRHRHRSRSRMFYPATTW